MNHTAEASPTIYSPHQRVLSRFHALSDDELRTLSDLERRRFVLESGENLLDPNPEWQAAYFLVDGWATSYKILSDGRRQILDCHVPGDILGFRSTQVQIPDSFIEPMTSIDVVEFAIHDMMRAMMSPGMLSQALSWFLARDYAILAEHLINTGRRGAPERMAHFLLELGVRLDQAGLADPYDFACPLTQYVLGDALGLSAIHVNRTLRDLRERELMCFRHGRVVIADPKGMAELSGFNAGYLMPTFASPMN